MWGPFSYTDFWLDSYVTDFLLRAKAAGYDVPEQALNNALDNLGNQVSYAPDFDNGGEALAYALYDLARAGRAAIGDLRYYAEARLDNFATPLAKAQIGAALALYGERTRAAIGFAAAVAGPAEAGGPDYAIAATMAAGCAISPVCWRLPASSSRRASTRRRLPSNWPACATSPAGPRPRKTPGRCWRPRRSAATRRAGSVTLDGKPLDAPVYRRFGESAFAHGADDVSPITAIRRPKRRSRSPASPVDSAAGLERRLRPSPAPTTRSTARRSTTCRNATQNDRFVVVLNVKATDLGSGPVCRRPIRCRPGSRSKIPT